MVGYGNVYALINNIDRTDLNLFRSAAVCLQICFNWSDRYVNPGHFAYHANTTFELPSRLVISPKRFTLNRSYLCKLFWSKTTTCVKLKRTEEHSTLLHNMFKKINIDAEWSSFAIDEQYLAQSKCSISSLRSDIWIN